MSNPKITPKNLSYDTTLPPFLARLQANNSSSSGRHEFAIARPKKQRTAEDIAEDEPVYFDEETGDTLTKSEWEEKDKETGNEAAEGEEAKGEPKEEGEGLKKGKEEQEKIAAIGGSRKRKVGKIVGGEEGEAEAYEKAKKHITKISKPDGDRKKSDEAKKAEAGPKKPAAVKKKGKKIKLSFGDDE